MFNGMEDQRPVYMAEPGDLFQVKVQHGIAVHRQQPVTGSGIAVLLQNP